MSKVAIPDQRTALVLGITGVAVGTWCLWQAFDARGAKRPFWISFFPGL